MNNEAVKISGIGYVVPGGIGNFAHGLHKSALPEAEGDALPGFDVRPFLSSVKGYLDPGAAYSLAAAALALGEQAKAGDVAVRDNAGVATLTKYGAPQSEYKFFSQFLEKGARYASPLLFPHSYANTAGSLAAIEFGFAGPHMVLYGMSDLKELLFFAVNRLQDGSAADMLVGVYEAVDRVSVADTVSVVNGAIFLWLSSTVTSPALAELPIAKLAEFEGNAQGGTVAQMLELLSVM